MRGSCGGSACRGCWMCGLRLLVWNLNNTLRWLKDPRGDDSRRIG
jgi:hypothetical protein